MANEALINLLDWCKRERENLQCQFDVSRLTQQLRQSRNIGRDPSRLVFRQQLCR